MSGTTAPEPDGDTVSLRLVGPVDELAAELADRAAPAVHPYEVAALLESEGLTGEQIRERYGHPDLFSLADELYRRVPRGFPEPAPAPGPWAPDHLRCALRGLLFALPGLAYPLTAPLWRGSGAVTALVVAGLVSWAWGQALGHRMYVRLASGRREAGLTARAGAPVGAALASLAALPVAGPGPAALFAVGQSVYLAAAGVLLVMGRERLLAVALLPLVAGGVLTLYGDPGPVWRVGLPLLTLAATTGLAGHTVRGALAAAPVPGAARPAYLPSLPYGLFGLAAGTLVLSTGGRHPYAVVALTVSMGPAEWLLYRFRGLSVAALRASATVRGFRLRAARTLALCLAGYLGLLVPAALLTDAPPGELAALGATLWLALLLQAFGVGRSPAAVCLVAAGAVVPVAVTGASPGPWFVPLCCSVAALVLAGVALYALGRPSAHA
ncbi:hypothetical protein [Streptomyces lavendofoliae]|uniref:Integral membrane protein n=1 Tax=Streptomyces lavendofoliae TaxID=67314 RepID=A0A918M5Z0_9ACTN|nr:hypothetical protein [Streptomyces lavendofoliae]GGU47212.1 hypothetical protein GCM10010274_39360 [Streptomyces lavendofoliae]